MAEDKKPKARIIQEYLQDLERKNLERTEESFNPTSLLLRPKPKPEPQEQGQAQEDTSSEEG